MKRQALATLPYGQGTLAPTNVLDYPSVAGKVELQQRKFGHKSQNRHFCLNVNPYCRRWESNPHVREDTGF